MAISFVGAQGNAGTTVTIPTHQSGDLILIFAYRDTSGLNPPSTPAAGGTVPTWTLIRNGTGNTNSFNCRYAVATGSTTTSGTWTNATEIICLVYRGAKVVGANASTSDSGTTITFPALTLNRTNNTSWIVGFAGHRTATNVEQAPTGMTNRTSAGTEAAGHDTNGTVSSWSQQTVTVNQFAGNQGCTVELRDGALTVIGNAGSFNETGQAAALSLGKSLASAVGSFNETGQAAALKTTRRLISDAGICTTTGQAATLTKGGGLNNYTLTADNASYSLTGQNANLNRATKAQGDPGSISVLGQDAALKRTILLLGNTGSFVVTGQNINVYRGIYLAGSAGSFSANGQSADFSRTRKLESAAAAFGVTGQTAELQTQRAVTSAHGVFTLQGKTAFLAKQFALTCSTGNYAVTGQAAVFDKGLRLPVTAGSYVETGESIRLVRRRRQFVQF